MKKAIYILAGLILVFASADASPRRSEKVQMIVRQQANGEWQVFMFGVPPCPNPKNVQVIYPPDSTQPLEIECDVVGK